MTQSSSRLPAFQDGLNDNHCWGCGTLNDAGLHIESRWEGEEAVCVWQPPEIYAAGPRHVLNGGIIATILDCHSICTAIADAYRGEGREMGTDPDIWYVTGSLKVTYLKPTPIDQPVTLQARVTETSGRTSRQMYFLLRYAVEMLVSACVMCRSLAVGSDAIRSRSIPGSISAPAGMPI